jgi:hypothetical protein
MGDPGTAILEAERAGFDSSLIEESLALSHEQRAVQHQRALDLALEMERAGRSVLSSDNIEKLRNALRDLRPAHRFTPQKLSFLEIPDPGVPMLNLYLSTEMGPVDILGAIMALANLSKCAPVQSRSNSSGGDAV